MPLLMPLGDGLAVCGHLPRTLQCVLAVIIEMAPERLFDALIQANPAGAVVRYQTSSFDQSSIGE